MHEYLKLLGTNNQHKADHFLIYERDLMLKMLIDWIRIAFNVD